VASKAQIYALVDALVAPRRRGRAPKAVLVASSDLAELLGLCDRIAVMCRGAWARRARRRSWTNTPHDGRTARDAA
jgi:ABC-type sugar transport system ATPase subunit